MKNEIAADCCFLRNSSRDVSQPVLVARDRRTGINIAHAVPSKGRCGVDRQADVAGRMEVRVPRQAVFRTDGGPVI